MFIIPNARAEIMPLDLTSLKSVRLFAPESDEPAQLQFTEQNGQVSFTVPGMKRYSMIVVSHQ